MSSINHHLGRGSSIASLQRCIHFTPGTQKQCSLRIISNTNSSSSSNNTNNSSNDSNLSNISKCKKDAKINSSSNSNKKKKTSTKPSAQSVYGMMRPPDQISLVRPLM